MVAVIVTAPADPPLLVQVALRGVGFRPGHDGKSVEVRAGVEPAHGGFADRSVPTSPADQAGRST
jgi:hypothetical protein